MFRRKKKDGDTDSDSGSQRRPSKSMSLKNLVPTAARPQSGKTMKTARSSNSLSPVRSRGQSYDGGQRRAAPQQQQHQHHHHQPSQHAHKGHRRMSSKDSSQHSYDDDRSVSSVGSRARGHNRSRSMPQQPSDYLSVRVVVGERMESVRCHRENSLGWLLEETIKANEEFHSKLRWGLTGLRRLQDEYDLDLNLPIGRVVRDGETIIARMLPPDFMSIQIILGDSSKEFVCPIFKTVEQLAGEATRIFGGIFQVVGLVSPQDVTNEFPPDVQIGEVIADGGAAIAVVAPFYFPLHGPWSPRFPESTLGAPEGFNTDEIEATWWDLMEKVLFRWVNSVLAEIGPDCLVVDLFPDIASGTPLLYLVVVLASEGDEFDQFDGFKPSGKAKMEPEKAVALVYQFLEQFIDLDDCPAEEILEGAEDAIASLIWAIFVFFSCRRVFNVSTQDDFLDTLFRWTSVHAEQSGMILESFGDVFSEGEPLLAVLHSNSRTTLPYDPSEDTEENLRTAYLLAEDTFEVPPLLDPDDLPNFCEQACVIYLTELAGRLPQSDQDQLEFFSNGLDENGDIVEGFLKQDRPPARREVAALKMRKVSSQQMIKQDGEANGTKQGDQAMAQMSSAELESAMTQLADAEQRALEAEKRVSLAESKIQQLEYEKEQLQEHNEQQHKLVAEEGAAVDEKTAQLVSLAQGRQERVLELEAQLELLTKKEGVSPSALSSILSQDIHVLKEERDSAIKAKMDLQQQMIDSLNKREERMKELTTLNRDYQRRMGLVRSELAQAEEEKAKSEALVLEAKKLQEHAESEFEHAKQRHEEQKKLYEEQQAAQGAMIKSAKGDASRLQVALDSTNRNFTKAVKKLKELMKQGGAEEEEIESFLAPEENRKKVEAEVAEVRRLHATLESESEMLKLQMTRQEGELKECNEEVDRLQKDIKSAVEMHAKEVREFTSMTAELKRKIAELELGTGGEEGAPKASQVQIDELSALKSELEVVEQAKKMNEQKAQELLSQLHAEEEESKQMLVLLSQADKVIQKYAETKKVSNSATEGGLDLDDLLSDESDRSTEQVELMSLQMNVSAKISNSKHAKVTENADQYIEKMNKERQQLSQRPTLPPQEPAESKKPVEDEKRAAEKESFDKELAQIQGTIGDGMQNLQSQMAKDAASLEDKLSDLGGFLASLPARRDSKTNTEDLLLSKPFTPSAASTRISSMDYGEPDSDFTPSSNRGHVKNKMSFGKSLRRHSYLLTSDDNEETAERLPEIVEAEESTPKGIPKEGMIIKKRSSQELKKAEEPPSPASPPLQARAPRRKSAKRPEKQKVTRPRRSSLTVKRGGGKDTKKKVSKSFEVSKKTIQSTGHVDLKPDLETSIWQPMSKILEEPLPEVGSIKVGIRTRPLSDKEKRESSSNCVSMHPDENAVVLTDPTGNDNPVTFGFDIIMDSSNPKAPKFVDQGEVFQLMGVDLLANVWRGYNSSIFAYGQTGAGKSYSMTGTRKSPGLTRRFLDGLFYLMTAHGDGASFNISSTYFEIFNEKVNDLLNPSEEGKNLRVREHPHLGPYCEGLKSFATATFEETYALMESGLENRRVESTNMNLESSRSHSVFSVSILKVDAGEDPEHAAAKESKVSLIDLAGSERADTAGADALKSSGKHINQSLATLGKCIQALVRSQSGKGGGGAAHIPFRESCLTWLLRDVLWGNAKTSMIAAISPADTNYEESISTLRWAQSAKKIATKAVVNEDPTKKLISNLKKEIEALKAQVAQGGVGGVGSPKGQTAAAATVGTPRRPRTMMRVIAGGEDLTDEQMKETPFLKVLNNHNHLSDNMKDGEDSNPSVRFLIPPNLKLHVGNGQDRSVDVELSGYGMEARHCIVSHESAGVFLELWSANATIYINGTLVKSKILLKSGDRMVLGNCAYALVYLDPRIKNQLLSQLYVSSPNPDIRDSEISTGSPMLLEQQQQQEGGKARVLPSNFTQAIREVLLCGPETHSDKEDRLIHEVLSRMRRPLHQKLLESSLTAVFRATSEANDIANHMASPALFEVQLAASVRPAEAANFILEDMIRPERVQINVRCFIYDVSGRGANGPTSPAADLPSSRNNRMGSPRVSDEEEDMARRRTTHSGPPSSHYQALMRRRHPSVVNNMSLVFQSDVNSFLSMLSKLRQTWQKILQLVEKSTKGMPRDAEEDEADEDTPFYLRVFEELDTEHSGSIDKDEVKTAMQLLGLNAADKEVEKALQRFDRSSSGTLDVIEFRSMLLEFMRAAFMRCIADMVTSERSRINQRFQGGEDTLLQSYSLSGASIAVAREEAQMRSTPRHRAATLPSPPNLSGRSGSLPTRKARTPSPPPSTLASKPQRSPSAKLQQQAPSKSETTQQEQQQQQQGQQQQQQQQQQEVSGEQPAAGREEGMISDNMVEGSIGEDTTPSTQRPSSSPTNSNASSSQRPNPLTRGISDESKPQSPSRRPSQSPPRPAGRRPVAPKRGGRGPSVPARRKAPQASKEEDPSSEPPAESSPTEQADESL